MPENDVQHSLLELTEPRTAPPDPAALVRVRVRQVRNRRRGVATVLVAATATAGVLIANPVTGLLDAGPSDPGVSGNPTVSPTLTVATKATMAQAPTVTPTYNDPAKNAKLPPPWQDEVYTKFPERNLYGPVANYLARGSLGGHDWFALTYTAYKLSEGCIVVEATDRAQAQDLGAQACFDDWPAGRRADWVVSPALTGRKPNYEKLDSTFVAGAVSAEARSVLIRTKNGKEYRTDAVGTPTSDKLRFFVYVVPQRDATIASVTPLEADGTKAGPPTGLPREGGQCYDGPREGHPDGGGTACTHLTHNTPTPAR